MTNINLSYNFNDGPTSAYECINTSTSDLRNTDLESNSIGTAFKVFLKHVAIYISIL